MKFKLLLPVLVLGVALLFIPAHPAAAGTDVYNTACGLPGDGGSAACSDRVTADPLTGPNGIIIDTSKLLAVLAAVTAVIVIIIGGFMYILSNGDSGKISQAKNTILYAVVGLIVIAAGEQIIVFVVSKI